MGNPLIYLNTLIYKIAISLPLYSLCSCFSIIAFTNYLTCFKFIYLLVYPHPHPLAPQQSIGSIKARLLAIFFSTVHTESKILLASTLALNNIC